MTSIRSRSIAALGLVLLAWTAAAQPPIGGPPGKKGFKGPPPGTVLPPPLRRDLRLTPEQERRIDDLERDVKARLRDILTPEQRDFLERLGPGFPPKKGPKKDRPAPEPREESTAGERPAGKHPFHTNVRVTITDTHLVVRSDGIPTHETAKFPNKDNPNRILKQNYRFLIPLRPQRGDKPTPLPMGPIGVALNGIPFYNPYNAHGKNAVEGPFAEVFDSCCGHPDPLGRYHYHKYPVCLHNPFKTKEKEGEHSPLIGYAFDGHPIYGPHDKGGKAPTDLDECNGHWDAERGYHYHVTEGFPYILGAYRGVPERANFPGKKR